MEFPLVGSQVHSSAPRLHNLRFWTVQEFDRFLVFYRVTSDAVEIVRVLHGAR